MAQYKLSDGRIVDVPDGDMFKLALEEKLKAKNLTAELITDEPGKESGADRPQETEVSQPQDNQQLDTESSSEDTSSELQSTEPILKFGAMGPFYEGADGKIIKEEDLTEDQKSEMYDKDLDLKLASKNFVQITRGIDSSRDTKFEDYEKTLVPYTNPFTNEIEAEETWVYKGKGTKQPVPVNIFFGKNSEGIIDRLNKVDEKYKTEDELAREKYITKKKEQVEKAEYKRSKDLDLETGKVFGPDTYKKDGDAVRLIMQEKLGPGYKVDLLDNRTKEPLPDSYFKKDGELAVTRGLGFNPNQVKITHIESGQTVIQDANLGEMDALKFKKIKGAFKKSKVSDKDNEEYNKLLNKNNKKNILKFLEDTNYKEDKSAKEERKEFFEGKIPLDKILKEKIKCN